MIECISSLQNQTYKNIEILLIDDGSTNDSLKICNMYMESDKRIKVFHQENKGVSVARNNGIIRSSADFILFVDPDDWLELTTCEDLKKIIDKSNFDVIGFGHFSGIPTNEKENLFKHNFHMNERGQFDKVIKSILFNYDTFKSIEFGAIWGKVYRKNFLIENKIFFYDNLPRAQDRIFNLHVFDNTQEFIYLNKALYHYRYIPNSATHKLNPSVYLDLSKAVKAAQNFILHTGNVQKLHEDGLIFAYYNLSASLFGDVFHEKNSQSYLDRRNKYYKILRTSPYKESLSEIEFSSIKIKKEKMKLFFMKNKLFFPLFLWTKIKKLIK